LAPFYTPVFKHYANTFGKTSPTVLLIVYKKRW
jgi:hypothetical protein